MMNKTCSINYGHLANLQKTLPTTDLNKKKKTNKLSFDKISPRDFYFFLSFQAVLVNANVGHNKWKLSMFVTLIPAIDRPLIGMVLYKISRLCFYWNTLCFHDIIISGVIYCYVGYVAYFWYDLGMYILFVACFKIYSKWNLPFNSLRPSNACMRRWIGSSFVQIMACRLFGAKPLSEPMLE